MKTPLLLCGALWCGLLFNSCGRDIRKLHIEKRIYRPGWYVSIPPRGEPITHAYPPPVQTPMVYPATVPQPRPSVPPQTTPRAVPPLPTPPGATTNMPPVASPPSMPVPTAPPVATQAPMPPVATPLPPVPDSSVAAKPPVPDSTTAATPPANIPDSSGSRQATASFPGLDLQGGFRAFAAGLIPTGRRNFPLTADAGFAGVGYTLFIEASPRLAVLASCSYRYARLPVRKTVQRPLPLPETAAAKEKIRLHSFCTETALRISLSDDKFINSIDAGFGIERITRSVYISKSKVHQPLPASGQQSVSVTKTKATGLYGINAWSGYVTGGMSHAGWRVFFNYRINKQTTHEADFPRIMLGVMYGI